MQTYLLVAVNNLSDAVDTAKDLEKLDSVSRAIVVRNAADKTESDQYVATYFTTTLALARLNEGINDTGAA